MLPSHGAGLGLGGLNLILFQSTHEIELICIHHLAICGFQTLLDSHSCCFLEPFCSNKHRSYVLLLSHDDYLLSLYPRSVYLS